MAFSRNAGFTSAIATDAGATAAGYLTPARYNLPHTVTDAVSGAIPYFDSTTSEAVSALLAANAVVLGGGAGAAPRTYADFNYNDTTKRMTVGSGANGATSGLVIGNLASSYGGIWGTGLSSPTLNNSAFITQNDTTTVTSWVNATENLYLSIQTTPKITINKTAGRGPDITAGTAASAVSAETITQTWNFATSAINAVDWTFTDTSSHANTLAWRVRGGASGTTALASLTKAGKLEAVAFRVNGADGVSFGPSAVTSITVVNGIITAIS